MDFSFTASQTALKAALAFVLTVVDRKSSMPVLSNVLVAVRDGRLTISGTDLYSAVTVPVDATDATDGSTCVHAHKFAEVIKSLPKGGNVTCTGATFAPNARAVPMTVACNGSRFTLPTMSGADYAVLPRTDEWSSEVDAEALAAVIDATQHAISSDDTRPHLNAMLLERDVATIRAVTTDGHRLALHSREQAPSATWSTLVSPETARAILRLASGKGDASVSVARVTTNGTTVVALFRRNGIVVSGVLRDEQFPPYAKVIPQMQDRRVTIGRNVLRGALKRAAVTASDKSGGVRLLLGDGSLTIDSENPDTGRTCEQLAATVTGKPLTIGFNARYLLDALAAVDSDEVTLELSGELDPGTMRAASVPGFVAVTMPMRV